MIPKYMSKCQAKLRVQHHEEEFLGIVVVRRIVSKRIDEIKGTVTAKRGLN